MANKIPFKPEFTGYAAFANKWSDDPKNKDNKETNQITRKSDPDQILVEAKAYDKKVYWIAIIVVVAILGFIMLLSMNDKPVCDKGDTQCEEYLNDSQYNYPVR